MRATGAGRSENFKFSHRVCYGGSMKIAAGGTLRPRGENPYARIATYDLVARPRPLEQVSRFGSQRLRNLPEHGDACRHIAALDRADVAGA